MNTNRFPILKPCLLAFALLALLAGGCARNDRPLLIDRYDSHGEAYLVKRIERHAIRDYWHHWKRSVYRHPSAADLALGGHDGVGIIDQFGDPVWVRGPFTSLEGQPVSEWLYLDEDRLFQFSDEKLVYEGPVTDFERTLLERGYPSQAEIIATEDGHVIQTMLYRNPFWANFDEMQFSDGNLIQSQEGN